MPTRSDHPYLLWESSKSHTFLMDPQQIVTMFAEINAKLESLKRLDERLTSVEATGDQTLPRNNWRNNTDNTFNLDAQYLKSIKIDVLNFDRCHAPQLSID